MHSVDADITILLAAAATLVAFLVLRRTRTDLVVGSAGLTVALLLEAFLGAPPRARDRA